MKKEVTVREVALKWIEEKRHHVKKSTYGVYLQILNNHIIPALGDHVDPDEETLRRFAMGKVEGGIECQDRKGYPCRLWDVVAVWCEKRVLCFGILEYKAPSCA